MLTKDIKKRPSAEELLMSPYFAEEVTLSYVNSTHLKNITNFTTYGKIQSVIYFFLVTHLLPDEEKEKIIKTFKMIDQNNDGVISKQEIQEGL